MYYSRPCRSRVSDPMHNSVPKSVHFFYYLNFGALFDIVLWKISSDNVLELVRLSIGYMVVNIELAKFV